VRYANVQEYDHTYVGGDMTRRVNLNSDIRPVSEFRAKAAELIEQIKTSGRPLVLTQRGHSAAVVLDVAEYQKMVEEIDLLRDVRTALDQGEAGQVMSNRDAKAGLRRRFAR
jgi:prevent-host-death family protein